MNLNNEIEYVRYSPQLDAFGKQCRVYKDGNHFVAMQVLKTDKPKMRAKQDEYYKESVMYFDELFYTAISEKFEFKQLKDCKKSTAFKKYLLDCMLELCPYEDEMRKFVENRIDRNVHNYYVRIKRMKRKCNLNKFNYFVTFTYDDKKHSEKSFREKIKKCLSNLANRRGWRYMAVFEKGKATDRLHLHALLYVPAGEMVGEIIEVNDYSIKQHQMQTSYQNTFFNERFGRSDFKEIEKEDYNKSANYLLKYINKTGEKVMYSRYLPSELLMYVENTNIACEFTDFLTKYVLFDDVIENNTYKPIKTGQQTMFEMEEPPIKRINKNSNLYKALRFYA